MIQTPPITDIRDLGIFFAGIAFLAHGIVWWKKNLGNSHKVSPDPHGDKRTTEAVQLVVEHFDEKSDKILERMEELHERMRQEIAHTRHSINNELQKILLQGRE